MGTSGVLSGGDSYRWYCEELSTQASTWRLQPATICTGPALVGAQACGPGCTCTMSPWDYGHIDRGGGFISHDRVEGCFATASCTFADGAATLYFMATGPNLVVQEVEGPSQLVCDSYDVTAEQP